ncbi:hypothetical protein PGQ11_002873 [Apiospora arundinis]|uniref:Uncharacterized protein n=1 Tax=Apiospora arundinis TaxID=335852 RepID=A0ABR2J3F5_9PEZI
MSQIEIVKAISATKYRLQVFKRIVANPEPDTSEQDQQSLGEEQKAFAASGLLVKLQGETVAKAAAQIQDSASTVTFGKQNSGFQARAINGGVSGISLGKQRSTPNRNSI